MLAYTLTCTCAAGSQPGDHEQLSEEIFYLLSSAEGDVVNHVHLEPPLNRVFICCMLFPSVHSVQHSALLAFVKFHLDAYHQGVGAHSTASGSAV